MGPDAPNSCLQEALDFFDSGEPATTTEIADYLDISRQRATDLLERLGKEGLVTSKTIADETRIWWPSRGDHAAGDTTTPAANNQFASLVAAVEEYAIFSLDTDGYVQTWNPGSKQIKGYEADQIIGEHFSKFYREGEQNAGVPGQNLTEAAKKGSIEDEGWRVRADGSRFWANVTITAIRNAEGGLEGFAKVTRDMTKRREHEEALRQQRDFTQGILDTAPVGVIIVDDEGKFTAVNKRASELLALDKRRTHNPVGVRTVYDEDGEFIPPEERPYFEALDTGESVRDWHHQIELPDGTRRWLSSNVEPMCDDSGNIEQVLVTIDDITQMKAHAHRVEQQRDELENELDEVFKRIDDAFLALDEGWRVTYVNDHAAELVRLPPGELIGSIVWEALPEVAEGDVRDHAESAMRSQESTEIEFYSENLDTWFEIRGYPSETGMSVYFRDVTERREYERRLEESHERLERFARAVSHDLREPLGSISSYLQLLERRYESELDEDAQEFIEFAVDGAGRMREMIDGLVTTFARVDSQGESFEPVDVNSVVERVLADLDAKVEESDATITTESLPTVDGDAGQIRHLLLNMLDNAIKYSGKDSPRIHIAADERDGMWALSVSDEGVGMDPQESERIFEVFHRLPAASEHPGTGIGLALCERIVERHQGDIWVDSTPGAGSTFTFTLPKPAV